MTAPDESDPARPDPAVPWDRPMFDELVHGMVQDSAPSRFAVVQETGDMRDGRIAAWGLAWRDRVLVAGERDRAVMFLNTPALAAHGYANGPYAPDISARVIWVDAEPEPLEEEGDDDDG